MVGDEVTVLYVDKSHGTMNTTKRFKDYVVMGIKYRNPENWESKDVDTKYYVVHPIGGYSDEEATGRMLSGGGRIREEHLYPSWDKRSKYGDKTAEDYDLAAQTPDGTHKEDWLDIGFKAQEVEALEIAAGYNKSSKTNLVSNHPSLDGSKCG